MKRSFAGSAGSFLHLGRTARVSFGIILCAIVVPFISQNASATGTYLLNEKFNDMTTNSAPTGWTSVATSGSVQVREYPFAADKSVRIEKAANSGESSISHTFANQSGKVAFEAKVLMRENNLFYAAPYIYDANGTAVVSIGFQDDPNSTTTGNIVAFDKVSNSFQIVQSFTTNDWYLIRV